MTCKKELNKEQEKKENNTLPKVVYARLHITVQLMGVAGDNTVEAVRESRS